MVQMKFHSPVLLNETIEGLNINPEGVYVDATFGGGGHTSYILKKYLKVEFMHLIKIKTLMLIKLMIKD